MQKIAEKERHTTKDLFQAIFIEINLPINAFHDTNIILLLLASVQSSELIQSSLGGFQLINYD